MLQAGKEEVKCKTVCRREQHAPHALQKLWCLPLAKPGK